MKTKIIKSIVEVEFIDINLISRDSWESLEVDTIDLIDFRTIPKEELEREETLKNNLLKEKIKIRENELENKTVEELKIILENSIKMKLEELHNKKISERGNRDYTVKLLDNILNDYHSDKLPEEKLKLLIVRVNDSINPSHVIEEYLNESN